ncbi:alpha/beta hydrolase [Aliishimia ponticola]|uniref:Alpha/beta hydrolase n=1 Tax=Aliishimia ponticola TaxID=2499833 RepID=A0A4S4N7U2_9RHOB|nr:alpha/beta hydrolase [Aliishimia ponticola]THH35244.1 alpha/beta hydrolase [Aliishimia ponticola]
MSLIRPVLNAWLRLTEKPYLSRVEDPDAIRRGFERKARFYFRAPSGTIRDWETLGGRPSLSVSRRGAQPGPLILYFHGGAYIFGSPRTHQAMLARLLLESGGRAILPEYRKAPENPFPAAVEDAVNVWMALLERGETPGRIFIGGDSAGGGLALALLGELLRKGLPLPAGVFALSPLTDLTFAGASMAANEEADPMLPAHRVEDMAAFYLQGQDGTDPRASPLFADFTGAPPVFLAVGDTEILRDDTLRIAKKLEQAGASVDLKVEQDLPHVWPIFHNTLPEARATLRQIGLWIRQRT